MKRKTKMEKFVKCHACNGKLKIEDLNIAQRIKYWRIAKGLTQNEMARDIGKNRPWLANIEYKDRSLSVATLSLLAKFFDVSLDLLINGKEKK